MPGYCVAATLWFTDNEWLHSLHRPPFGPSMRQVSPVHSIETLSLEIYLESLWRLGREAIA